MSTTEITTPNARDGGREPRDATRARILDVALQLIAARGFAATSTREISEALGFTKAALYYHFRTKDELLDAIVAPAMDELTALVGAQAPRPGAAAFRRRILDGYIRLVASHENLVRVLALDPAVRRRFPLDLSGPVFGRLIQLLSGTDQPDAGQRARARAAVGAVHLALLRADPGDDRSVVLDATRAAAAAALGIAPSRVS